MNNKELTRIVNESVRKVLNEVNMSKIANLFETVENDIHQLEMEIENDTFEKRSERNFFIKAFNRLKGEVEYIKDGYMKSFGNEW